MSGNCSVVPRPRAPPSLLCSGEPEVPREIPSEDPAGKSGAGEARRERPAIYFRRISSAPVPPLVFPPPLYPPTALVGGDGRRDGDPTWVGGCPPLPTADLFASGFTTISGRAADKRNRNRRNNRKQGLRLKDATLTLSTATRGNERSRGEEAGGGKREAETAGGTCMINYSQRSQRSSAVISAKFANFTDKLHVDRAGGNLFPCCTEPRAL